MKRLVCLHGHEMTDDNTLIDKKGHRRCWTCRRQRYGSGRVVTFDPAEPPRRPAEIVTAADVIAAVAYDFNMAASVLMGKDKRKPVVIARRTAAYVLWRRGGSFPQVGRRLRKDHSTVIHAVREFEAKATPTMRAIAARYVPDAAATERAA